MTLDGFLDLIAEDAGFPLLMGTQYEIEDHDTSSVVLRIRGYVTAHVEAKDHQDVNIRRAWVEPEPESTSFGRAAAESLATCASLLDELFQETGDHEYMAAADNAADILYYLNEINPELISPEATASELGSELKALRRLEAVITDIEQHQPDVISSLIADAEERLWPDET